MLIFDYLYEHVPNCIPFPEETENVKFNINIILANFYKESNSAIYWHLIL